MIYLSSMERTQTQEFVAVVPVRDAQAGGMEVFLLRDPGSTRYWFPNSCVRDADVTSKAMARCHGITKAMARHHIDHRKSALNCLGYWVAASRELFVRTGVLFCSQGDLHTPPPPETRSRLVTRRILVETFALEFLSLLEVENLFCDLRFLVPFAKWHTPSVEGSGRTEIFITRLSSEHDAWPTDLTGDWVAPVDAMVR